jgi:uroporphyrinogen decarboxylase
MTETSRERLLKSFRGEKPDRVPVTLFLADQGHFINQLWPEIDPWDTQTLQLKVIEFCKEMGCDVFLRVLYGLDDPIHIIYGGLDVSHETHTWQAETEEIQRGTTVVQRSTIHTPKGTLTQDFSVNEIRPGTLMFACTKKPIESMEDLETAMEYEPPMPESWPEHARKYLAPLKEALGDDGVIGTWTPMGPYNNCSLLFELDELYTLFLTDPEFYEKLITFAMERAQPYARAIDEAGVDVHCIGGNVPGGFLGKRTFDRYILSYEKEYIDFIQANGTPAMYHNCGEVMNLIESYKHLGVKIVEPFSPPPTLGDADQAKAVEVIRGDYVVVLGVDHVNVLQNGSVDDVRRVTEETMRTGKSPVQQGRFIIQSADFLEYGTPVENVEAYVETALEHAEYDW